MNPAPSFAYLADGKLFCVRPGRQAEPLESQFVANAEERRAQHRERNRYREQGMMWNFGTPPAIALPTDTRSGLIPSFWK